MMVIGAEFLEKVASGEVYEAKMVFNRRGAVVFSADRQHRDVKGEGISYEDNYVGNAMAAMVRRELIEIRFHRGFSDRQVAEVVQGLLARPEFSGFGGARVTYQGRVVVTGRGPASP